MIEVGRGSSSFLRGKYNMLSLPRCIGISWSTNFKDAWFMCSNKSFKLVDQEIPLQRGDDNMLYLPLRNDEESPSTSMIYHERFGHPGKEITHLLTQKYSDLNGKLKHSNDCDTCIRAKIKGTPFGKNTGEGLQA